MAAWRMLLLTLLTLLTLQQRAFATTKLHDEAAGRSQDAPAGVWEEVSLRVVFVGTMDEREDVL